MLSRSLKCYSSLATTPQGASARFGVGRRNAIHFTLARLRLENLRNFRAPLVFKAKFSAVLATSRKFCISEKRLGKIYAYGTFQARKSEQFDRKCQTSSPRALFPGFGGRALHLQSQRKCQVCLNRTRISAPNDSDGSGERLSGEGNSKMELSGPSSTHTACVLAVRLPWQ